jgi:hypothetical protein
MSNGLDHSERKPEWRDSWPLHDKIVESSALGWDSSTLIRFNSYFDVTQMVQLGNFEALGGVVKISDMHG